MPDIFTLREAAAKSFSARGATVSNIRKEIMFGVPVLGALFPKTFGRAVFDSFTVTLPTIDPKLGPSDVFEVTARLGGKDFEVVHDRVQAGWLGPKIERKIKRAPTQADALRLMGVA